MLLLCTQCHLLVKFGIVVIGDIIIVTLFSIVKKCTEKRIKMKVDENGSKRMKVNEYGGRWMKRTKVDEMDKSGLKWMKMNESR